MKKYLQHLVLAVCILLCVMPFASVAQSKKSRSNYLDNIYKSKSSQNQNRGRNNGASQFEQLLKDAKQQADKQKEQERKRNVKQKDKPAQGVINSKKEKDDISLVVSGEGPNKTEATKNALRSAIEQTYGTFVSASTEIMNDELVKDEIATVASGNIKSYKELSSIVLPNGNAAVTLSATVSIGKLIQYTQSHGGSAEFAGQTFMMNIRMRELNKRNELKALNDMLVQLRELENDLFDFSLEVKNPLKADKNNIPKSTMLSSTVQRIEINGNYYLSEECYLVPVVVTIKTNSTYELFQEILSNTLNSLSLTSMEKEEYHSNNMEVLAFAPYQSTDHDILNSEVYFLRNDVPALMEINAQVCAILNNAQKAFYIRALDSRGQEWRPSDKDIINVNSEEDWYYILENGIAKRKKCVETQFGEKALSTVPRGKNVVFNSIEHSFLYATKSLGEVRGFEVVKL